MKCCIYVLGLVSHVLAHSMELTSLKNSPVELINKYESAGPEKFSIFVPDIKPSLSIYDIVTELKGSSWIPLFQQYSIDLITACYTLFSIRNERVLPKEIWCHIFQFLKFDRASHAFILQDTQWRFTGYIPTALLTKKIFSFDDFDIEMPLINDTGTRLKLKNKQALLDENGSLLITKLRNILKGAQLIEENTRVHADCNTMDEYNNRQILLSFFCKYPLSIPFFCTSFIDGKMDNKYCDDCSQKYENQITIKIDENYSETRTFRDYIRSYFAWIDKDSADIWLIVETMDESICLTDEGAHHNSHDGFPSRHYINILKRKKEGLLFQKVEEIRLPLLQLAMNDHRIDRLFANARCSVQDVIDDKIIIYDSLKRLYLCFELCRTMLK
jgi:hypothetical protein